MALIKINNTSQAKSDAEEIGTVAVELDSARESIEYVLNEVKAYWEQTQPDAVKFTEGLQKNVETLTQIVECNKEFSRVIEKYAETQEKTGEQSV